MAFIRFPLSLKDHIQTSIQRYDPSVKVSFTGFIDPTTNTPMVDMEYDPTQIPEDQVQDLQDWIKREVKEAEEIQVRTINFPCLLNEDQLKVVIHVTKALGYSYHKIEINSYSKPFTTQVTLF